MVSNAMCILALCISPIANGSFSVPLKLCRKRHPGMPDFVFMVYFGMGVAAASLLTIPVNCTLFSDEGACFIISPLGVFASLFCALATASTFLAIRHLGVGLPPSIYAATTTILGMLLSFWFEGFVVVNAPLLGLAVLAIIVASVGVAASKRLSMRVNEARTTGAAVVADENASLETGVLQVDSKQEPNPNIILGYTAAALGVGVCGSMVPFTSFYAPKNMVPFFGFAAPFGIGSLVTFPSVAFCMWVAQCREPALPPADQWALAGSLPYGLLSGFVWGIGNGTLLFSMAGGIAPPTAVAIWQCGLIISGLWGILLFREISGLVPVFTFFLSAAICLCGIWFEGHAIKPL